MCMLVRDRLSRAMITQRSHQDRHPRGMCQFARQIKERQPVHQHDVPGQESCSCSFKVRPRHHAARLPLGLYTHKTTPTHVLTWPQRWFWFAPSCSAARTCIYCISHDLVGASDVYVAVPKRAAVLKQARGSRTPTYHKRARPEAVESVDRQVGRQQDVDDANNPFVPDARLRCRAAEELQA